MKNIEKFFYEINKLYAFDSFTKIRIGNEGDGGYILFKELCKNTRTVYSVGVGDDVGFETDWITRYPDSKIKLFDPTIDMIVEDKFPYNKDNISFTKKGVDGIITIEQDSLLKMDIEWNEWEDLQLFNTQELNNFSQIIIEFHIVTAQARTELSPYFSRFYNNVYTKINDSLFVLYHNLISWLNESFYIYHIHPNNSLQKVNIGNYWFPPLLEISFIRKDCVKGYMREVKKQDHCELDYPNKKDRRDIFNYFPIGYK